MCGIFALLNIMSCFVDKDFIKSQFEKGKGRGPDDSNILDLNDHSKFNIIILIL